MQERQHVQAFAKARKYFQSEANRAAAPQKALEVYARVETKRLRLLEGAEDEEKAKERFILETALVTLHARLEAGLGFGDEGGEADSRGKGSSSRVPRHGSKCALGGPGYRLHAPGHFLCCHSGSGRRECRSFRRQKKVPAAKTLTVSTTRSF